MFIHYTTDPHNPSVDIIFPWTFAREWNAKCKSLVKRSPKYPSICWKREFGMIWMKNNYGTKLRKAFPNRQQIRSKSEIWKAIFEHLNR
jgi:signal recognition particle subunit SEC65